MTQTTKTRKGCTRFYTAEGVFCFAMDFKRPHVRDELVKLWESGGDYRALNLKWNELGRSL